MLKLSLLKLLIRLVSFRVKASNYLKTRKRIEGYAALRIRVPRGYHHEEVSAGGVPGEWLWRDGLEERRTLLYLHGGGYVFCSPATHRDLVRRISDASGSRVLSLDYRLAPEHPHPAALEDALTAYRWLLKSGIKPSRLGVLGDSAGGGLTLALLQTLRDRNIPLPACAVCLSPWTDLYATGNSIRGMAGRDPLLRPHQIAGYARLYAREEELQKPAVSPLYGDFSQLPPLLLQAGSEEILLDDSRRAARKAETAGTPVRLEIWPGMIHVFQALAHYIPEGKTAIARMGAFIKENIP